MLDTLPDGVMCNVMQKLDNHAVRAVRESSRTVRSAVGRTVTSLSVANTRELDLTKVAPCLKELTIRALENDPSCHSIGSVLHRLHVPSSLGTLMLDYSQHSCGLDVMGLDTETHLLTCYPHLRQISLKGILVSVSTQVASRITSIETRYLFADLSLFRSLRSLTMYVDCNRWKDAMQAISNLPYLTYLNLEYTSVAIGGPTLKEMTESLAGSSSLTHLRLHGMLSGSLESIQYLTNLVSLSITFSHWHHVQVLYPDKLASLTNLTSLEMENAPTDAFCSTMHGLRSLTLRNHCATAPTIGRGISHCTNLESVSLKNYIVPVSTLVSLRHLQRVEICLLHVLVELTTTSATLEFLQTLLTASKSLMHVDFCDKDVACFSLHAMIEKFSLPGIPGWTGSFVPADPELIVSRWVRLQRVKRQED